jgi:class 3 adenylate cyclase/tetratricopeptide (TPR) repeat protein
MAVCRTCEAELPPEARFCPACAAPVEADPPSEERKLATVLFADLVGSTELGDSQDPERTRVLLDRFYDAMAEEVERAGGTLEKFAGDAVMAAFGAPVALEDHAERALHAALAMRHRVHEIDDRLELRIGVNTGEVVVGRPREGSSFVTGDPVNVAARLEQGAEPGEILVGERSVAVARGAFEFGDEIGIDAKGKPEGVRCRRLVRALSLTRPRGVGGLRLAFVGRDAELERLLSAYRDVVAEGRPRLVTILGDAGVGKSRLVRELWERLPEESLRRTGRCLPYGRGIMYRPLADVLKEHFGILESDSAELVLERLGERRFLGLALGLDVAEGLHPLLVRDRFQDEWTDFLASIGSEQPLVLLVEDVHWAEEQLLDLLERLVGEVAAPLLLLATARPEILDRRPGWSSRGTAELVELEALSAEDSTRLLDELLVGGLPAVLREVVVARAEGNPFFVEELLGTLIDRGLLQRENGGWTIGELPPDFSVPDSVQAVLAARIDLLEPAEKEALQAASVIGRVFWSGPVYELVQGEPDLRVLEDRDFIRRRPGSTMAGEREYAVKHALTREVAYESLPKARRARLHAAFARWLERSVGDEAAPLLAHHYAEAVRPADVDLAWTGAEDEAAELRRRAVVWLSRAGELAASRYELEDAIGLLRRAIELEDDRGSLAALWHSLGNAHALRFDGERFVEAMQTAIELTDDAHARAGMYADLALHAAGRSGMWRRLPEEGLVEGWIEQALAGASGASATRAKALVARSFWHADNAVEPAREASTLAEQLGDMHLRVLALEARALAAFGQGDYSQALTWADRVTYLIGELTDPDMVADAYAAAIPAAAALGRFREAERLAGVFREVNEPLTPHHRVHGVAVPCEVAELRGGWERILELEPDVVERVEANLETPCVRNARTLLLCALAHEHVGDKGAGRELEQRARELWMEGYGLVLDATLLKLALARGDLAEVERLCEAGFKLRRQTWFFVSAITARIEALAALRRVDELEEAVATFSRPKTVLEPFALRALGIAKQDRRLLLQAVELFESFGLDWHAERTRALEAQV